MLGQLVPVTAFDLVIFGATGDLSRRKLLPALFNRWKDGQIPASSRITGVGRRTMTTKEFAAMVEAACRAALGTDFDSASWSDFSDLLDYREIDVGSDDADWSGLAAAFGDGAGRPCVLYLATAPDLYVPICLGAAAACPGGDRTRLVLEKPIGSDLSSARRINAGIESVFEENQVFRIDHYLGKETVQNLMVLRFANALFEPLWSRQCIDHVQITAGESIGLEGRAAYYDDAGALRDMVQNHMLQLLCMTAMEPPNSLVGDDIRTEKIKVLRALRCFDAAAARRHTVRGQYQRGIIDGRPVPSYAEELDRNGESDTETFVALRAEIANWRWAGVPFYLRTGKRMSARRTEIVVHFKPPPHAIFGDMGQIPNRLVMRLQPDEAVRLYVQIKQPGPGPLKLRSLPLNLSYAESFARGYPDAYERLLMEVVRGNLGLFMRREEVEAAWNWTDTLIAAWDENGGGPDPYPAGSDGPTAAAIMIDRDGRSWSEGLA